MHVVEGCFNHPAQGSTNSDMKGYKCFSNLVEQMLLQVALENGNLKLVTHLGGVLSAAVLALPPKCHITPLWDYSKCLT